MAVSVTTIGGYNTTTNATEYTFTPGAPTANALRLLWVHAHSSANTAVPTIAGMNSAWTAVTNIISDGGLKNTSLFWSLTAAPNTSTVTVTHGGAQLNSLGILHQYTGVGANAPVQSVTSVVASAAALTCILSSLASAGNVVAAGFGGKLNSAETASSDFILLSSFNQNSPAAHLGSAWTSAARSRITQFQASASSFAGIAVEISAATPSASVPSPYYHDFYTHVVAA